MMEKKMETSGILGLIMYNIGLGRNNGKEHGSYYLGFRV